jgi:hypothetical protein
MRWSEFEAAARELALFGRERIDATGIVLLGTLRADGWPRISPCEAYLVEDDLLLGMMPGSMKVRDLERDPRLTVATPQADRNATVGDLKLYGYAGPVRDPDLRRAHADTQERAIGWRPPQDIPLFAVEIHRAGFISFGEGRRLLRWKAGGPVEELPHPGA